MAILELWQLKTPGHAAAERLVHITTGALASNEGRRVGARQEAGAGPGVQGRLPGWRWLCSMVQLAYFLLLCKSLIFVCASACKCQVRMK